ncbi:hypothetical protein TNCV_2151741 [Trichonephila clavipes]|uniref:Uncharacterized protein n=1 Tax=Trichonephila clavipes TaxID=2585209 RepID=A0A8X6UPE2_TRICX|nr:hypothetical protein TNCV_2151741 [Trichonephila clavipes]
MADDGQLLQSSSISLVHHRKLVSLLSAAPYWRIPITAVFASAQLILLYLGTAAVAFPARSRHALLAKDLVTWQAMVGRHNIVGRVAQYVDEHYPIDKWHLGDLIAWVAQSALKYRPRICELSKCLEGPLKMIVCPKKLLPTLSHLVKLLYAARQ